MEGGVIKGLCVAGRVESFGFSIIYCLGSVVSYLI